MSRPGNDLIQLRLFADYASNLPPYPKLHAYLRHSQVPLLAVWGRNDQIFAPEGTLAFADDAPGAGGAGSIGGTMPEIPTDLKYTRDHDSSTLDRQLADDDAVAYRDLAGA